VGYHSVRSSRLARWLVPALLAALVLGVIAVMATRPGARPRLADAPHAFTTPPLRSAAPEVSRKTRPALPAPARRTATPPSPCRGNVVGQRVIVSIAGQHAWICARAHQVRDSAVTTGTVVSGGTPTGAWHVQAKQTDRWLGAGGEAYQVKYWMPYDGDYGFHDASWQKFAFGGPQYRTAGSHGCVHFPIAVMAWLYGWAQVGATVTVTA
jgi:lipoprotein-anchoring transpeptidase ErfK/SrfK